jgi:hypothetical protein
VSERKKAHVSTISSEVVASGVPRAPLEAPAGACFRSTDAKKRQWEEAVSGPDAA